jgi:hypothetical protein
VRGREGGGGETPIQADTEVEPGRRWKDEWGIEKNEEGTKEGNKKPLSVCLQERERE